MWSPTHDVDLAWAFADNVALFKQGRVIAQGDARDVLIDEAPMNETRLKTPFLARIGLGLRACGVLGADEPLPRDEKRALALLARGFGGGPARAHKPQ